MADKKASTIKSLEIISLFAAFFATLEWSDIKIRSTHRKLLFNDTTVAISFSRSHENHEMTLKVMKVARISNMNVNIDVFRLDGCVVGGNLNKLRIKEVEKKKVEMKE